jgi:Ca2+-transporting ATPase
MSGRPTSAAVPAQAPWAITGAAAASLADTDPRRGLGVGEAAERLATGGANEIAQRTGPPVWRLVAGQLTDTMILVLLASAALTAAVGDLTDTTVILAVIAVNTTLGVVQEVRAGRAIAALSTLTAPQARVVRDSSARIVAAREVVEGDLLRLAAGDIVPADARLLRAEGLETDEAALTGESVPVGKSAAVLQDSDTPLAERSGMVHAGTVVTRGHGDAIVTGTASRSALGRIARLLDERGVPLTPLQRRLGRLGRQLSVAATLLCLLVGGLGLLRGEPLEQMLVTAVSLAVAAIPESLPAVVSLSLALGAQRMAARGALVRHLPAVETLGSVTVIASDKTGTLTEGTMAVQRLWTPAAEAAVTGRGYDPTGEVRLTDGEPGPLPSGLVDLLVAGALCNDAELVPPTGDNAVWGADGDPTEAALLAAAARAGLDVGALHAANPRVAEVSFDSVRARMTTAHRTRNGQLLVVCKGSPESVLDPSVVDEPSERLAAVRAAAEWYASAGQRVLAVAAATRDGAAVTDLERGLQVLGLAAMADPLRPSALPAVTAARDAGIRPVVITGDHPATVASIATRLGILADGQTVLTGRQLAADPGARATVYARTAPEQKLDIVTAWQSDGHVVAMTGDGVNDAPALRVADIGVAMGRRGTEVAKQAADLVLTDDDFGTVVAAVAEGRRVYDNIRRFVCYGLSGGAAEILVMLAGPFLGLGTPLLPAQILWINLLTHGVPGVALGVEPAEPDVLARPPRRPAEGILTGLLGPIARLAVVLAAASLAVGIWAERTGRPWQSMLFATLALGQLGVALALRTGGHRLTGNPFLTLAVAADAALVLAALYWAPLQALLGTEPLGLADLGVVVAASLAGAVAAASEHAAAARRRRPGAAGRRRPPSAGRTR